ncbi:MAG: SDR family NAD(P)-dependent oxidoreductase [Phycisphaerae bacterium]|nr:SDR family NAD(P)-dependent oxidoreductase [Phycisphaerae bacterium]
MIASDSYRGRSVLVTGGAGFIGSHLTDALLAAGAAVTVLDDLSTGYASNLEHVGSRIRFVRGSVTDADACREAVQNVRTIFHLAAYVSAAGSVSEPVRCHECNTTGTLRILDEARRRAGSAAPVERIVLASSAAVYGESEVVPKREDQPVAPVSVYAQSKAAGEHLLQVWSRCYGVDGVALRFFNVFGPRQRADSAYAAVIAAFASALLSDKRPIIHGDGEQTRDFIPVANITDALLAAGAHGDALRGSVFNVGMGVGTSVNALLSMMRSVLGRPGAADFQAPRAGDVRHSVADVARLRSELGWSPRETVKQGMERTLEWYSQQAARA